MKILLLIPLLLTISIKTETLPPKKKEELKKISHKQTLKKALNLPLNQRSQFFQKRPHYFGHLQQIFQEPKSPPSMKWQALMSMARLNPQKTSPLIDQALNSSDWFLKNAGLIALEMTQPAKAVRKAGQFLDHPALMLRTAGVELIRRRKAKQYKDILWTQLGDPQNFRNGKSLWIRRTIAQTLSEFSDPADQDLFFALLEDEDPRIHSIALRTLQRIKPLKRLDHKAVPLLAREKTQKQTL